MPTTSPAAAPAAATLPLFLPQAPPDKVSGLFHAATLLAQLLGQGRALDSRALRSAMEAAFGGSDAEGAWVWKDAYEACEAAQVLFLRKFGGAMRARAGSPAAMLDMLARLAERLPSQTRRSEESERFQQFSTPITLGFVAAEAAALTPADLVLEPSAGTGLLAIFAELARARLALNEIADTRAGLLAPPVPRRRRHPAQRRAYPRPSRSRDPPERRADEPALLGLAACRGPVRRGRDAPCHVGARAACRRRTPRRHHRPQCRSRPARLARRLRPPAGEGPRRVHGGACRPGLCPPRHHDRDAAHRHRSRPGRRSARISIVAGDGRDAAELLDWVARLVPPRAPVTGAVAARPRRGSGSRVQPRPKAAARSSTSSSGRRRPRISSSSPTRPASGRRPKPRA